jgi:hypothetical protein
VHELNETHLELRRTQQLLGGMIAIIRVGGDEATNDLLERVRTGVDISSLSSFVRNEVLANRSVEQSLQDINFNMNAAPDLPSPSQLLRGLDQTANMHPLLRQSSTTGPELNSDTADLYITDLPQDQ